MICPCGDCRYERRTMRLGLFSLGIIIAPLLLVAVFTR